MEGGGKAEEEPLNIERTNVEMVMGGAKNTTLWDAESEIKLSRKGVCGTRVEDRRTTNLGRELQTKAAFKMAKKMAAGELETEAGQNERCRTRIRVGSCRLERLKIGRGRGRIRWGHLRGRRRVTLLFNG